MKDILNKKLNVMLFLLFFIFFVLSLFGFFDAVNPNNWIESARYILDDVSKYSFWTYINSFSIYAYVIYLAPFVIAFVGVNAFHKMLHSGFLFNLLQRTYYKTVFIREIAKCWLTALILPIMSVIIFIFGAILYKNSAIIPLDSNNGTLILTVKEYMTIINPDLFIFLHFILLVLFGIIVINIAIIFTRYIKNIYLVSLISFLFLIFYEVVSNTLIGPFLANLVGIKRLANGLSIYNLFWLDAIPSMLWEFIFAIIMILITLFIIYIIYLRGKRDATYERLY
ncbi:MAG: hypothetical protein PHD78_04510 [Bacilli bacterium]|nr:hypothetical protein [Bacilli bacterium]MDD4054037.1 hypothetical protein [Bacilli bacterium]MDD4411809.1 hypothetical protein [Bacilli bacterium]